MSIKTVSANSRLFLQELLQIARSATCSDTFLPALLSLLDHTVRPARHPHPHLLPYRISRLQVGKVLDEGHRRIFHDTLGEFKYCLNVVRDRYPALFDPKAEAIMPAFLSLIDRLRAELKVEWPNNMPPQKVQGLSGRLLNIYPYQETNSIFRRLVATQIYLKSVLDRIVNTTKAAKPDIAFKPIIDKTGFIEDLYVIAPNAKDLEAVIGNFISKVTIDAAYCELPTVYISVSENKEKEGFKKIIINLYTNFRTPHDAQRELSTGPGMMELHRRDFKLFGMRGDFEIDPESPDGMVYSVRIWLEISKGFKPPISGGHDGTL